MKRRSPAEGAKIREEILDFAKTLTPDENGWLTGLSKQIANRFGVDQTNAAYHLTILVKENKLRKTGQAFGTKYALIGETNKRVQPSKKTLNIEVYNNLRAISRQPYFRDTLSREIIALETEIEQEKPEVEAAQKRIDDYNKKKEYLETLKEIRSQLA